MQNKNSQDLEATFRFSQFRKEFLMAEFFFRSDNIVQRIFVGFAAIFNSGSNSFQLNILSEPITNDVPNVCVLKFLDCEIR